MLNLEEAYPALIELNATDAARIGLTEAIEKSFAKEAQKSMVPLGAKVLMRPKTWPLAIWEATVGHPQVKTRLAFALHKANPTKYPAKPSEYTQPPKPPTSKTQEPYKYMPPKQGFVKPHKPMELPKVESPKAVPLPPNKYTPDQLHKMLKSKDVSQTEMAVQDIIDTRAKVEIMEKERVQTINNMLKNLKSAEKPSQANVRPRFDLGRNTYEMTVEGKRKIVKMTSKGMEEIEPFATFRGWQENVPGKDPIALYNIEGGRLNKSTVTRNTLEKEGIKIPETPPH